MNSSDKSEMLTPQDYCVLKYTLLPVLTCSGSEHAQWQAAGAAHTWRHTCDSRYARRQTTPV